MSPTDPRPGYPPRPPLFALHFCRRVVEAGVANDLGPPAALLLMAVALREDATRYSGPVSYFNGQLLTAIGVGSVDALACVRAAAVDAGWLHYRPGRRGVPGRYWVADPGDAGPSAEGGPDVPTAGFDRTGADEPRTQPGGNRGPSADEAGFPRTGADDPRTIVDGNRGPSADEPGLIRTGAEETAVDPRTIVDGDRGPSAGGTGFLRVSTAPVRSIRGPSSIASAELLLLSSSCPNAEDGDGDGDGEAGTPADAVLRFPTSDGPDWPLPAAQVAAWAAAYRHLDVPAECRKAHAWLAAQPRRRPTADLPAFLVRWLNRAADRPPRAAALPPPTPPPAATLGDLERAGLL